MTQPLSTALTFKFYFRQNGSAYNPSPAPTLTVELPDNTLVSNPTLSNPRTGEYTYTLVSGSVTQSGSYVAIASTTDIAADSMALQATWEVGTNDATSIAASVWNALTATYQAAGSFGALLVTNLNATISGIAASVWSYATRTLTGGSLTFSAPVNTVSQTLTISTGKDYNQTDYNRDIQWSSNNWSNLSGATISFNVQLDSSGGTYTTYGTSTVTGAGGGGALQTVHLALTASQNTFLVNAIGYSYTLSAVLSNNDKVDLVFGKLIVTP